MNTSKSQSPSKFSAKQIKEKLKVRRAIKKTKKLLGESGNESKLSISVVNKTMIDKQKGWISERRKLRSQVRDLQV